MDEGLQKALELLTFETVRERSTPNALRLHGRASVVDTLVSVAMLVSDKWVVDVSYHFFPEVAEGRIELRVGWRIVVQPRQGVSMEEALRAFSDDVRAHFEPPKESTTYEVTEVPLLNTPPNRNAPTEKGKGALFNTEIPLGVKVTRELRRS